jgi:hypothetical protein
MLDPNGESTMPGRKKHRPPIGAAAVISEAPTSSLKAPPIIERPDGFYWVSADGRREFGPFESAAQARADRDRGDEEAPEPGETLQEAEREIGIADWIDPETGAPAEGQSPPHLEID